MITSILVVCTFILGFAAAWVTMNMHCSGDIILHEDSIYLNISKKDAERLQSSGVVKLHVKRKNFNGFNEQ